MGSIVPYLQYKELPLKKKFFFFKSASRKGSQVIIKLAIGQINGTYEIKVSKLIKYAKKIKELLKKFEHYELVQVP